MKKSFNIPENVIIESIKEGTIEYEGTEYKGLVIGTDKGNIMLIIEDFTLCCENYGSKFLETPDNVDKFIGAKIIKIEEITINNKGHSWYEKETQLKITTSKGVLQYAVYNAHNGYYTHASIMQVFNDVWTDSI